MTALPYVVVPFTNASGTTSYRVSGSWKGERIRKNFGDRVRADAFCNSKNVEALAAPASPPAWTLVQTRLSEDEVRLAEAAVARLAGRWSLRELLDVGLEVLAARPSIQPVEPLVEQFLEVRQAQVALLTLKTLRIDLRRFVRAFPGLTTAAFTRALVRKWLDEAQKSRVTKVHWRAAVHQFGAWLVERDILKENPASGIKLASTNSGAERGDRPPPAILTPGQAEALLRVCEEPECRPILGWMATTIFTGMRPESEAPRATWAEINFETKEWTVMGRKRGAKPRVIPLTPAAVAWLEVVHADKPERPAEYSKWFRRLATKRANEWLAIHRPGEKPIAWIPDLNRHTFASYRSPLLSVQKLAEEMGTSPAMIYAHYRKPIAAAPVGAFWALRPRAVVPAAAESPLVTP
jgi:integrase